MSSSSSSLCCHHDEMGPLIRHARRQAHAQAHTFSFTHTERETDRQREREEMGGMGRGQSGCYPSSDVCGLDLGWEQAKKSERMGKCAREKVSNPTPHK